MACAHLQVGQDFGPAAIERMLEECDTDHDGKVDYQDFAKYVGGVCRIRRCLGYRCVDPCVYVVVAVRVCSAMRKYHLTEEQSQTLLGELHEEGTTHA